MSVTKTATATRPTDGLTFRAGDLVRFSTGTHRGSQSLRFTITHFTVHQNTLYGKPVGTTTYVYGTALDGVAFGGCLLSEIEKASK